jgi:PTS system cellobiose-specific IIB component
MRILVVCGAGASSTFVAQRLRRAASDAGLSWDAAAGTETSVDDGDHDLVLLGPHLADRLSAIRSRVNAPVALLPDDVFADRDGLRTLALARTLLTDVRTTEGTP